MFRQTQMMLTSGFCSTARLKRHQGRLQQIWRLHRKPLFVHQFLVPCFRYRQFSWFSVHLYPLIFGFDHHGEACPCANGDGDASSQPIRRMEILVMGVWIRIDDWWPSDCNLTIPVFWAHILSADGGTLPHDGDSLTEKKRHYSIDQVETSTILYGNASTILLFNIAMEKSLINGGLNGTIIYKLLLVLPFSMAMLNNQSVSSTLGTQHRHSHRSRQWRCNMDLRRCAKRSPKRLDLVSRPNLWFLT